MPTQVHELVAALLKLPQHAEVEVMVERQGGYSIYTTYEPVDLEFIRCHDYSEDRYKDSTLYQKVIVQLEGI